MNIQKKQFAAVLMLVAMAGFVAWPLWKLLNTRAVSQQVQARTKTLVDKNPQLLPAWTIAMQDEVLTDDEAKVIIEAAGEKVSPNE